MKWLILHAHLWLALLGAIFVLGSVWVAFVSWRERENRATVWTLLVGGLLGLLYLSPAVWGLFYPPLVIVVLLFLPLFALLLFFLPYRKTFNMNNKNPHRFDERDTMFAREELQPGTEPYRKYYQSHSRELELDRRWRELPGLLSRKASLYDPEIFPAADGNFKTIAGERHLVDGTVAEQQKEVDARQMSDDLKRWLKDKGAVAAGVTRLRDYHLYSHRGRGEQYGRKVRNRHRYAIAFLVEMRKEFIDCAPYAPTVWESSWQYLVSGRMAIALARQIRGMGYPARAHIDGNYELICPLVARDAGLGEIGRMGLLMSPVYGPRVRIAVVTTDLPLVPDARSRDTSMITFCEHCRKCAACCPSQAIPFGDREEIDGVLRWRIRSEACFEYWCRSGTDCARCLAVCPYAHNVNLFHNLIRWAIHRSPLFGRLAAPLDDLFYGRQPRPKSLPAKLRNQYFTRGSNPDPGAHKKIGI